MTRRRISAAAAALAIAIPLVLLGTGTARASTPPYYFKWAGNHSWCITDPGNSTHNGTKAVMEHCVANTPGQSFNFIRYEGSNYYEIATSNAMCLEDPAAGANGTPMDWWACATAPAWMIWAAFTDSTGHIMWVDNIKSGGYYQAFALKGSNPFAGATVQAENAHLYPLPADTDQQWCVTYADGSPVGNLCP